MIKEDIKNQICAGIVTYNPNLELLKLNIEAICHQVSRVFVIDNGSMRTDGILELQYSFPNITFVMNKENVGIATALNQIAQKASEMEFEWFLTLDQDSVCPDSMIEIYGKYVGESKVAIICPYIELRVLKNNPICKKNLDCEYLETTITSGSLVRTEAWLEVGGFWDYLFIDKVDDDFCYILREKGWKILRINEISLKHEIGRPKSHRFFGKQFYTDSYPSFRYYYIARNTVIVYSCYTNTGYKPYKIILKRAAKIIIGEDKRISKLSALCKGTIAGVSWRIKYGKRGVPSMQNTRKG